MKIENLNFSYSRDSIKFENFELEIPDGAIFCLAGPNGAGKTTLMNLLAGVIPYGGKMTNGVARESIYYLPDTPRFYKDLSAKDNLRLFCKYKNIDENKIESVMASLNLSDAINRKVKAYSLGMTRKLAVAEILLLAPPICVLDEPLNGLDPLAIEEFKNFLVQDNKKNKTTFLVSSHLIGEISDIITDYAIIDKAKLIYAGKETAQSSLKDKYLEIFRAER
jgi:ABC-2 type transport system ATP-binding protein